MRIALISDIHGNLPSLELVLKDIQDENIDQIVCLGDVASLGPQPREVIARLRELQIPIIMGNHDNYVLDLQLTENHHPWMRAAEAWCRSQLDEDELEFLHSFQPQVRFPLDQNTSMLCFHGSPRSNEEFIYPDASPERLEEIFSRQDARLFVGGHTHVQMIRQHKHVIILNPGSVGMPLIFPIPGQEQRAILRAEYAIVEMRDGILSIDLRQLPIDYDEMVRIARASGLPDADFWISAWDTNGRM